MFSHMPKASGRLLVQDAGGVLSDSVVGVVVVFVSPLIVSVNVSFFIGMYGWGDLLITPRLSFQRRASSVERRASSRNVYK